MKPEGFVRLVFLLLNRWMSDGEIRARKEKGREKINPRQYSSAPAPVRRSQQIGVTFIMYSVVYS